MRGSSFVDNGGCGHDNIADFHIFSNSAAPAQKKDFTGTPGNQILQYHGGIGCTDDGPGDANMVGRNLLPVQPAVKQTVKMIPIDLQKIA